MKYHYTDVILYVGYVFVIWSFFMTDILLLRIIAIIASLLGILVASIIGFIGLLVGNALIVIVNLYRVAELIIDKRPLLLPRELRPIYENVFQTLTTREFYRLYKMAIVLRLENEQALIKQGDVIDNLYLLISGSVSVIKNDHAVGVLQPGSFIGEMRFLTGNPMSADVIALETTECCYWTKATLQHIEEKFPQLYARFLSVVGVDLVKKLSA